MPTTGAFHAQFWDARAQTPAAVADRRDYLYPKWQSNMQRSYTLSMAIWAVPGDALYPFKLWLRRAWGAWVRFYRLKPWTLSGEQLAVLDHVTALVTSAPYETARREVRACAVLERFNRPEQMVDYSRALRADARQTQNTYRHLRALHGVRALEPDLGRPDANLLVELAYHGFALTGRDHARHIEHPKKHVEHVKRWVTH